MSSLTLALALSLVRAAVRWIDHQWRKKMLLNRGAVNKIVRKARKIFLDHTICLQTMHAHFCANLAVKQTLHHKFQDVNV